MASIPSILRSHAETLAGIDVAFAAFAHGLADYGARKGR